MTIRVTAGKDNVPMDIMWPPIRGDETLEELQAYIQPQAHEWFVKAYPEHKIIETIVRIQRVGPYLHADFSLRLDPNVGPPIIEGIKYEREDA